MRDHASPGAAQCADSIGSIYNFTTCHIIRKQQYRTIGLTVYPLHEQGTDIASLVRGRDKSGPYDRGHDKSSPYDNP